VHYVYLSLTFALTLTVLSLCRWQPLYRWRRKSDAARTLLPEEVRRPTDLETLTSGVGHDLNNKLFSTLCLTDDLLQASEPGSRVHDHARLMHEATRQAVSLSQKLMAFAMGGAEEQAVVDLRGLVKDASRLLGRGQDPAVRMKVTLAPEPAFVVVNPNRFLQAILRLVETVSKKSRQPGGIREPLVEVTVDRVELDKTVLLRVSGSDGSERDGPGSALIQAGIAECRSIIENHDGSLEIARCERDSRTHVVYVIRVPLAEEVFGVRGDRSLNG